MANAIGVSELAANAVTAVKINANAVTTDKLNAGAVTAAVAAVKAIISFSSDRARSGSRTKHLRRADARVVDQRKSCRRL